jgi:hypothetical protein
MDINCYELNIKSELIIYIIVYIYIHRYKKHSAAKDLSSKTPQELAAILGHGGVSKTQSLVNESDEDEKATKKKRKDKKKGIDMLSSTTYYYAFIKLVMYVSIINYLL